jgi:hypothetical protein
MAARLAELTTVGGLVARMRDVAVLGVRLEADSLWSATWGDAVPFLVVDVHAADWSAAELVALRWNLAEREGRVRRADGAEHGNRWRVWSGWVPELSQASAVWLSVTAAEGFRRPVEPAEPAAPAVPVEVVEADGPGLGVAW